MQKWFSSHCVSHSGHSQGFSPTLLKESKERQKAIAALGDRNQFNAS
jgi:hypothetical protein